MSATPQETNTAPAPQTPKKNQWKWIAIGCLGIVVLTIGGCTFIGGCALLMRHGAATGTDKGKPSGVEEKNPMSSPPTAADSRMGLWRNGSDASKGFIHLKPDGAIKALTYTTKDGTPNELTGKYSLSDGNLMITDVIYAGAPQDKGFTLTLTFEVSGDTARINGEAFKRVPAKDVDAVLANPTAP